jgi:hypothetical protein
MSATARLWITALYDQDDSRAIAQEATNMAKAEEFLEASGRAYHRQRLQNGTVDLSVELALDELLPFLGELRSAGIAYGSLDVEGVADSDPRLDAIEAFDPHLIVSVEV